MAKEESGDCFEVEEQCVEETKDSFWKKATSLPILYYKIPFLVFFWFTFLSSLSLVTDKSFLVVNPLSFCQKISIQSFVFTFFSFFSFRFLLVPFFVSFSPEIQGDCHLLSFLAIWR